MWNLNWFKKEKKKELEHDDIKQLITAWRNGNLHIGETGNLKDLRRVQEINDLHWKIKDLKRSKEQIEIDIIFKLNRILDHFNLLTEEEKKVQQGKELSITLENIKLFE